MRLRIYSFTLNCCYTIEQAKVFQHFSEVLDLLARGISLRKGIMPIEYQVRQYDLHKQHAALFRRLQGSINFTHEL